MEFCPECHGDIEDMGDYLECIDCGMRFDTDSTFDDYEEIDEGYDEETD